jgi:hypothetical protein
LEISAMERPQPRHKPDSGSISQMSMQGVSMGPLLASRAGRWRQRFLTRNYVAFAACEHNARLGA